MRKKAIRHNSSFTMRMIFLAIGIACIFALNGCVNKNISAESEKSTVNSEEVQTEDVSLYSDAANELVNKLNVIDCYAAGIFGYDESSVVENLDSTREHAKVTDGYFANTAEFSSFVDSALTEQLISSNYSYLFDGDGMLDDGPRFYDIDSVMYGEITRTRSGGFTLINNEPSIGNITDTSFTAVFKIDNEANEASLSLDIVMSDGIWKINNFNVTN